MFFQQTAGGANLNNLAKLMSNNERAATLRNIVITGKTEATFLPGLPRDVAIKGDTLKLARWIRAVKMLTNTKQDSLLICAYTQPAVKNLFGPTKSCK